MPVLEALNPDKTQPTAMRSFSNFQRKGSTTSYMEILPMLTTPLTRTSK